jgi:WD40 repeat protein
LDLLHQSAHPLSSYKWPSTDEKKLHSDKAIIDFGPGSDESNSQLLHTKIDQSLFIVERTVQQNIHIYKILTYSSTNAASENPRVDILLKFSCQLTQNRSVTDLCFNGGSHNFFAVSYSALLDLPKTAPKTGLIVIWNILNPGFPERIIKTGSVPTSITFSEGVPYLLAVGFEDGSVGLYDIRPRACTCIALSTVETGSHDGPVGEIVFQQRTDTRIKSEAIISVATGGRVTQWTVANGLEHKDLVVLKKLKPAGRPGESQTLRYEDLHCISFNSAQPNIYVTGSEDGALFVCDSQYNEDFVSKLLYHYRSVFALKFSPIVGGYFLSASCDGSVCLWHTKRSTPLSAFHTPKGSINDVDWSPISSTVFAAASSEGDCKI